jgi:hypothetical protein
MRPARENTHAWVRPVRTRCWVTTHHNRRLAAVPLVVAIILVFATFWTTAATPLPSGPSADACQDGQPVGQATMVRNDMGVEIAVLEIVYSNECRASWGQLTPADDARGAELKVTLRLHRGESENTITDTIKKTVLRTGTLANTGSCVSASVSITSSVGAAQAQSRCVRVGG